MGGKGEIKITLTNESERTLDFLYVLFLELFFLALLDINYHPISQFPLKLTLLRKFVVKSHPVYRQLFLFNDSPLICHTLTLVFCG